MASKPDRLLWRVSEAAEVLGISRALLYRLISEGVVQTVQVSGGSKRITAAELGRYVAKLGGEQASS